MRSCSSTRSTPNTASVTGCSTCSRVFISRKKKPSSPSTSSTVPAPSYPAASASATAASPISRPQRIVDGGGGSLLDDLLVTALQRALALAEVDAGAVPVGEHLHLDVTGAVEVALDEDAVVAERRGGLALRRLERAGDLGLAAHDAHPAPAAARDGLDDGREPVLGAERADVLERRLALGARDGRHARVARARLRARLVAHEVDRVGRRPDPDQAGVGHGARERRALGQEPVARVHARAPVRAAASRIASASRYDSRAGGGPIADRDVGGPDVLGVLVRVGEDRDRRGCPGGARCARSAPRSHRAPR